MGWMLLPKDAECPRQLPKRVCQAAEQWCAGRHIWHFWKLLDIVYIFLAPTVRALVERVTGHHLTREERIRAKGMQNPMGIATSS